MFAKIFLVWCFVLPSFTFAETRIGHGPIDADLESAFKKLLSEKNPKAVRARYLDRLLNVRYRTELYLQAFEKELKTPLKNGKEFSLDQMESYAKLLAVHPVQDSADDAGITIYQRSLETAWAAGSTPDEKATALAILNETYEWIRERSEEDRIIISDWLDDLENMGKEFEAVASQKKEGGRQVASVLPEFDFAQYNFGHQGNLSAVYKKHKSEITKIAQASAKWKDVELQESIAQYGPASLKNRAIASTGFKPAVGPEGTFSGEGMGSGHYSFTFDDGPQPTNTERIIDIATHYTDSVNTKGVPLTFFWLEVWVAKFPKQVEHAKSLGYVINNHSWTHLNFALKKAPPLFKREIVDSNEALKAQFGVQPALNSKNFPFYRCPYGACVTANNYRGIPDARQMIADQGLIHIYWKIDSNDWANKKNPERTTALTIAQMEAKGGDHGIILMHDFWPRSPDAFRMILDYIHKRNDGGEHLTLVPVTAALAQANGGVTQKAQ